MSSARRSARIVLGSARAVVAATVFAVAPALVAQRAVTPDAATTGATIGALDLIDDVATRTAIRTLIAEAAANGLPTAPLVTKVREGVAKRAAPDRIRTATSLLAQRLAVAVAALATSRGDEELAAGADALQVGVRQGTLSDMRRIWPTKSLTVPLGVLVEMITSGVPHASASKRVRDLLLKGANTAQLASLGANVRADIAAGLAPDAAMELRSKGVLSLIHSEAVLTLSSPASPGTPIRPGPPPVKR